MLGALLGGPVGMTGYVLAISNIGPAYTAVISAFYPAFGTLMAVLFLRERMQLKQIVALAVALAGVIGMGYMSSAGAGATGNAVVGLLGAAACVIGWGSEAVLCAWGMRDDAVDNETALQIRETTSALAYGIVVVPLFGAWGFAVQAFPSMGTAVVAASALAGAASYLFYYKGDLRHRRSSRHGPQHHVLGMGRRFRRVLAGGDADGSRCGVLCCHHVRHCVGGDGLARALRPLWRGCCLIRAGLVLGLRLECARVSFGLRLGGV